MSRRCLWILTIAACGRSGFEARSDARTTVDGDVMVPCPDGYVRIAADPQLGSATFCAMQFEARGTGAVAVTSPAEQAWTNVSAIDAVAACRAVGAGYDLIANVEWMTIARSAEETGANWSGGVPGAGSLVEGWSRPGASDESVTDLTDAYAGTGFTSPGPNDDGWEQRRTIVLANGAVIWDLPGTNQEWVNWTLGDPLDGAPPCQGGELTAIAALCPAYGNDDYNSRAGTFDRSVGAGYVIGGTGDAVRRGGQIADYAAGFAGIYGLNMNRDRTATFGGTGFRCVYRSP